MTDIAKRPLAPLFRRAAEIVLSPDYHISNGSCGAIGRADLGWDKKRWKDSCDYDPDTDTQEFFRALFNQHDCYWWDDDDRETRAFALCLAAAIAERPWS